MDTLNYALDPFNLFPDVVIQAGADDDEFGVGIGFPDLETGVVVGGVDSNGDGNTDALIGICAIGGHAAGACIKDTNFNGNFDTFTTSFTD